jgi:hypothetical protein
MSYILNSFLINCKNVSLLRRLSATGNFLTRIPLEIRFFPSLAVLNFFANRIDSIKGDDFKFQNSTLSIDDQVMILLDNNKISYIEPDAFEGKFVIMLIQRRKFISFLFVGSFFEQGSVFIQIGNNKLSRFESSVFRPLLEKNSIFTDIMLTNSIIYFKKLFFTAAHIFLNPQIQLIAIPTRVIWHG